MVRRPIQADQNKCLYKENEPKPPNGIVAGNLPGKYIAEYGNEPIGKQDQADGVAWCLHHIENRYKIRKDRIGRTKTKGWDEKSHQDPRVGQ